MADKKITDLDPIATLDVTDVLPVVDLTDDTTKKVTVQQIIDEVTPGGAVDSVNGQTGTVVLTTDLVAEGATDKYVTAAQKTKLDGIAAPDYLSVFLLVDQTTNLTAGNPIVFDTIGDQPSLSDIAYNNTTGIFTIQAGTYDMSFFAQAETSGLLYCRCTGATTAAPGSPFDLSALTGFGELAGSSRAWPIKFIYTATEETTFQYEILLNSATSDIRGYSTWATIIKVASV